jgi:hypothetical protein
MCIPQTGAPFFCVRTFLPLTASVMNISCVHALIRNMNKGWNHETSKFLPLTASVMIISCMHAQIRDVKSFLKLKNMENPFSFTLFAFDVMPHQERLTQCFTVTWFLACFLRSATSQTMCWVNAQGTISVKNTSHTLLFMEFGGNLWAKTIKYLNMKWRHAGQTDTYLFILSFMSITTFLCHSSVDCAVSQLETFRKYCLLLSLPSNISDTN